MTGKQRLALRFALGLLLVATLAPALWGQAAAPVIAIQGAKIYTLASPPIENGTIVIRGSRIAAVGANVPIPAGAQVIDGKNLSVYPGLFDSLSRLGLTEVGAVSATVDTTELGAYNPQLLAATAVNPASEHIPVARANGITHAVSAPGSGGGFFGFGGGGSVIPGQASLINLSGWTVEEMLVRPSVGMILNWPTMSTRSFDFATFSVKERPFSEAKKEYEEKVAELEDWFQAAQHYAQAKTKGSADKFERDLKLEAMVPVIQGELPLIVVANRARDIKNAVEFVDKHHLKMILAGGAEAWKVKELLKEKNIPVILRPTQSLPGEEDEPYDKPFTNAAELYRAGVRVAFATFDSSDSRTLPYEAANAVPYGLPYEEALKGVTLYPAQFLGIADQVGTLEVGKLANLIVTDGDPLEIQTQVRYLFINGRETSTDNRHRQLYERYRARP